MPEAPFWDHVFELPRTGRMMDSPGPLSLREPRAEGLRNTRDVPMKTPASLDDVEQVITEATRTLQAEFLQAVPVLTDVEVSARSSEACASTKWVHEWRASRRIFSIHHRGQELYPAFQFRVDGQPQPIIAEILPILAQDPERTDWDNALWFASETGWLDGERPIDCLFSDPSAVRLAAEQGDPAGYGAMTELDRGVQPCYCQ